MRLIDHPFKAELELRILRGLSLEWEQALGVLDRHYADRMRTPFFGLGDMKRTLGKWIPRNEEIRISRYLVMNHPWSSVVHVLRHEMAHQMADQIFHCRGESPHGPSFRKACYLLRADPRASDNFPTLDELIEKGNQEENDKIMLRVRKLFALSESSNRYEAEAAMQKAHDLIRKFQLELISRNEKREYISIFIGTPKLRRFREEYSLARLIRDFYFVDGLWVSSYVMEKGKMGRVLEISGTPKNVRFAEYVHAFVSHYIDREWNAFNHDGKRNRYAKTDFAVGVIDGFRKKLTAKPVKEKSGQISNALIKSKDTQLSDYMKYRYPKIRYFTRKGGVPDEEAKKAGLEAGKKMVIHKGISEKGDDLKLIEK